MKRLLLVLVAIGLSSCGNTVHGVGQDMENIGQKIQETF